MSPINIMTRDKNGHRVIDADVTRLSMHDSAGMNEFFNALRSSGAKNVRYDLVIGAEVKDVLTFDLVDKQFTIESGRGGKYTRHGASFLECDVVTAERSRYSQLYETQARSKL